jgi:hypothetical protein
MFHKIAEPVMFRDVQQNFFYNNRITIASSNIIYNLMLTLYITIERYDLLHLIKIVYN